MQHIKTTTKYEKNESKQKVFLFVNIDNLLMVSLNNFLSISSEL